MRSFTIQIPKLCPERWDEMQPTEQGRFCAGCQKTVVDYTALSDRELVKLLAHASETSCGRFRDEQLNRPLTVSNPGISSSYRQWIGLLALSVFGWQTARAQQNQANRSSRPYPGQSVSLQPARPDYTVTSLPSRTTISTISPEVESVITGRVMISDSGGNLIPVSNAYIIIGQSGGTSQAQTDPLGTYRLLLPTRLLTPQLTIRAVTVEAARGITTVDVPASTQSIVVNDIILKKPGPVTSISAGGIALIPTPSRWQKLKRKLFPAGPKS